MNQTLPNWLIEGLFSGLKDMLPFKILYISGGPMFKV